MKQRIETALGLMSKPAMSASDVHEARKSLKKARASLRLLRPALRPRDYSEENARLRDAARPLGVARDAKVLPDTLHLVAKRYGKPLSALKVHLAQVSARVGRAELAHSRRMLREARSALADLELRKDNWHVVGPALKQVYSQGRRALAGARERQSPEAFHEWRKQAKYLRYALEILEPLWPPLIHSMVDEAHELTNCLGNEHDLTMLTERIGAGPLSRLITQLQREHRRKALVLGARLYEEKPKAFESRFGEYWKQWRHPPRL